VRGWCYILEGRGRISKGDFGAAERFITEARKSGDLPLDICAEDATRATIGLPGPLNDADVGRDAESWIDYLRNHAQQNYTPIGFWDDQDTYVEVVTEKLDLRNLFERPCAEFHVPVTNFKGWSDLNSRPAGMSRFAEHEAQGRQCILLVCVDHDPGGLLITDTLRRNLEDLASAVGWSPYNLI
jgi:hypothetical protein